jgi:hypothetical protein
MKPRLPGLPTFVALMLCAMIAAWLGIAGPVDLDKIKGWQTLIGAAVTAIGISVTAYIAVRNVTRQIRVGILSREEDRIERELPGLYDARNLCDAIIPQLRPIRHFYGVVKAINDLRLGGTSKSFQADVEALLVVTDAATRRSVTSALFEMYSRATVAQGTRALQTQLETQSARPEQWDPAEYRKVRAQIASLSDMLITQGNDFQRALDRIERESAAIARKIDVYERRSARIRREIETFFEDEQ